MSQLEKSREAVDLANIRAKYAEVMTAALTGDTNDLPEDTVYDPDTKTYTSTVDLTQKKDGWQTGMTDVKVGGVEMKGSPTVGTHTCTIVYVTSSSTLTITNS